MSTRIIDGFACTRCGEEPEHMVPDGFGARGQLFRCADGCYADTPTCKECGARFDGTRSEARQARWEPYSYATQQAIDHGPMACPDCVARILDRVLDILRRVARA